MMNMENGKGILEKEYDEEELIKKGYLKVWMLFEVQSTSFDTTKVALKKHIDMIKENYDIIIIEENLTNIEKVEAGEELKHKNVDILFSQVSEVLFLINSYEKLTELVINYGPTAVEIIAPEKIMLSMREGQNSLVLIADMMHKFAAQGVGGIVIKN
ncbi:MAG: hypothetical protein KAI55_03440 [Candidatus Aenigmarchaeota archaeon]|nr:hypothetical protein [Candidatus Aenigmarchaeota archaeon]